MKGASRMTELTKDWNWLQWWMFGTALYLAGLWFYFKFKDDKHD